MKAYNESHSLMNKALTLLFIFTLPCIIEGQGTILSDDQKIIELSRRLSSLEKANHYLEQQIRLRDSVTYVSIREEIHQAYVLTKELQVNFNNTKDKIAVTALFARLMQVNNPTSDILGFRFSDIVFTTCEKHFLSEIDNEKEKKRFGQIIHKIINNPIVSSIANTNPVTSIISSLINTISSFTTSSLTLALALRQRPPPRRVMAGS